MSGLGGGYDLEWYSPLDEEGNTRIDGLETVGCHVGPYSGLNITGAQPNFEYTWINNDPKEILRTTMRGGQPVQSDDPEFAAYHNLFDQENTAIDTSQLYKELVLIRTPIEKVRERREREQKQAELSARGNIDSFLEGADAEERQQAQEDGRGPTRFVRRDHGQFYEQDGQTEATWTPGTGIVRR